MGTADAMLDMDLSDLVSRKDESLRTEDFADLDASENGLQVDRHDDSVTRVAFSVDAAVETIESAVDWGADLMVVHHGLSWDGIERVTGRHHARLARLLEADLGLYVSHLPLDAHPDHGNAAGLADLLSLSGREPFGALGGESIGQRGRLSTPRSTEAVHRTLEEALDHGGEGVQVLDFGPEPIEDVAIVTGSGADWFDEAVDAGVDAFVTGEGKGQLYHQARESAVTVFLGGHYATETFGVRALATVLENWGLETTFIDAPTGL
ncbi:dinuclear metal center protein, YbgI/SA1388 family [Halanaeroarchaeum sulfurireducens]|uniref:Dinuclear metal center protein, YbgI/SA1388 family n=2 Tax=Halanaeroarchaeum sulfurireducens TaxID=1604004 RepID=A0A0N9MKZ7_9EURY|nr:dinuclear metal center protein, YbgI/SA1388 family [Halanaeroarchaeum sulfurireducens]